MKTFCSSLLTHSTAWYNTSKVRVVLGKKHRAQTNKTTFIPSRVKHRYMPFPKGILIHTVSHAKCSKKKKIQGFFRVSCGPGVDSTSLNELIPPRPRWYYWCLFDSRAFWFPNGLYVGYGSRAVFGNNNR